MWIISLWCEHKIKKEEGREQSYLVLQLALFNLHVWKTLLFLQLFLMYAHEG